MDRRLLILKQNQVYSYKNSWTIFKIAPSCHVGGQTKQTQHSLFFLDNLIYSTLSSSFRHALLAFLPLLKRRILFPEIIANDARAFIL
jgi:hypothetical protein